MPEGITRERKWGAKVQRAAMLCASRSPPPAEGAALIGHREEMCPGQPLVSLSLSLSLIRPMPTHSPVAAREPAAGTAAQCLRIIVRRPGGPYDLDLSLRDADSDSDLCTAALMTPTPTPILRLLRSPALRLVSGWSPTELRLNSDWPGGRLCGPHEVQDPGGEPLTSGEAPTLPKHKTEG